MLDMGFIPDIERICKLVPFTRQTLFFTATMPPEIRRITEQFLHNPIKVEVSRPATAVAAITQLLVKSGREGYEKRDILRRLIRANENFKNAIIFCNRKREVAQLHRSLVRHGFNAAALHGDMSQPERMAALDSFRKGDVSLLIASDVAARGLDIPDVSHIFNFDVPFHADDYVHRIGRTGRAGRSGTAISIVTGADSKSVAAIEKLIGQSIPWMGEPPAAAEDEAPARAGDRRQGRHDRHGTRDHGSRERKPERKPDRKPRRSEQPPAQAAAPAAPVARIEDARPRRPQRPAPQRAAREDAASEMHLPAFLLRPVVRAKA
jgi:superfamily II DNA/RNA helicase